MTFFKTGKLLKQVNGSFISLIPKCENPSNLQDYRPISLFNFLYKIISKVMAIRLSKKMNSLVSPNQTAFIKGGNVGGKCIVSS